MAEESNGWGFYGRKKELADLSRWMSRPVFRAIGVIGGRGVGKTELIREAAERMTVSSAQASRAWR